VRRTILIEMRTKIAVVNEEARMLECSTNASPGINVPLRQYSGNDVRFAGLHLFTHTYTHTG